VVVRIGPQFREEERIMLKLTRGALIVVLALLMVSCGGKYMIKSEPLPKPSEGKALVNFMRPSSFGRGVEATIWDGENLIGWIYGKQAFQYECDPGKHLFISWSEYKSPVEAELLPGRVYYIILRTRMGFWRARIHQVPLNPEHELWQEALTWSKTLPNYTFDKAGLDELQTKGHDKILEYLQDYNTEVAGTKHVLYLRPEDGVPIEP
jgi:hypothetical protein